MVIYTSNVPTVGICCGMTGQALKGSSLTILQALTKADLSLWQQETHTMPGPNKWNSVILKLVIEIDGVETIVKQVDYTESMNEISEEQFVSSEDVREIIMEDIEIGESGIF
jgi:ATP phosphoribosyltransferase regulatory subunit HisZ